MNIARIEAADVTGRLGLFDADRTLPTGRLPPVLSAVSPSPDAWILKITRDGVVTFNPNLTPAEGSEQAFAMLMGRAALQNARARG